MEREPLLTVPARAAALAVALGCALSSGCELFGISEGDGGAENIAGEPSRSCEKAGDCIGAEVCDPATLRCVSGLPCSSHDDCGGAAYCYDGTCIPNMYGGPCDHDAGCVTPELCLEGTCGCASDFYEATALPSNVLVVLDRSQSMLEDIGGATKWDVARDAISAMVAEHDGTVSFGLMLYPGTDVGATQGMQCGPGVVLVEPALSTQEAIDEVLAMAVNTSGLGTPTAESLTALLDYPGLAEPNRDNYVMLITDGESTCADPVPVAAALLAKDPEIKTFVVGFGAGVDPLELDALAQAGGTAPPQPPYYYQADDASALAEALAVIAGSVLSCTYLLAEIPDDPSLLFIYASGYQVLQDDTHANGWDFDPTTGELTFYGPICDSIKSGTVTDLLIAYGCPPLEIE